MRKLLLFFALLSVSIGTWAQGIVVGNNDAYLSKTTWNIGAEKVVRIKMEKPGSLAAAIGVYTTNADLKDAKVVHIYFTDNNTEGMNEADIEALSTLNVETIDLQDAFYTSSKQPFTFTNSKVKSVILPDGWDKEAVNAAGIALSESSPNLGSCFSMSPNTFNYKEDNTAKVGTSVIAYVAKGNTLRTAIYHCCDDENPCTKLSTAGVTMNTRNLTKLKSLTILGYPSASDFSDSGDWDANGHFVPNYEPFEFSNKPNARLDGTEVKTDRKSYVDGVKENGALEGCGGLVVLDLRDAIITEEYCNDLTLTWTNAITKITQQVWIPTTPLLKTIPADFLSDGAYGHIREICIPANIENIKTRAFASSSHNLVHVWTTGDNEDTVYDNGAWITDGKDDTTPENDVRHFGMAEIDQYDGDEYNGEKNVTYGTYTLSENIKLIESNAFATGYFVKDVYCLGVKAPECHVDAFTSPMYNGFNTYDPSAITEGIIDREAYTCNKKQRMYMAVLHYPRECQTPNVQRYTDPTREYSVATGMRDGRGNNVYFPNQSEFTFAYAQGTSGYVWQAWADQRTEYGDMEIVGFNGFLDPHSTDNQKAANTNWTNNKKYSNKSDRSFYDVTLDGLNMSTITAPSGLAPYYNTIWEDAQLYPQAKSVTSNYVYYRDDNGDYVKDAADAGLFREYNGSADDALDRYSRKQVPVLDGSGNLQYEECEDGLFVKEYEYVADNENGTYIHDLDVTSNNESGKYAKDFEWEADNTNGTHYHPFVEVTKVDPYNAPGNTQWQNHYKYENGSYVKFSENWQYGNYPGPFYAVSEDYARWSSDVTDFIAGINDTKYKKNFLDSYHPYNPATDAGEDRFDVVDNGYREATTGDEGKQLYSKVYSDVYRHATADDANEQRYCVKGTDYVSSTPITYNVANDYRGWHQFVLTAYATNRKTPLEPVRSFINDCDWWTICVPYDLKYSDMVMFFGTEADKNNGKAKIPYLSKLMYVIRDQENSRITLMFSKNLMEYKEKMTATDHVHGTINDQDASGKYTDLEIARDPVILHAGVPYLIKPDMTKEADGKYKRQFDIFADKKADLYQRLKDAAELKGHAQMNLIYNGEYTVPAYVIGEGSEKTVDEKKITNRDGSEFTYKSGKIKYFGEQRDYKISDDFTYTFVGTYYNSVMPQFCYFLGWDKTLNNGQGGAAFWYNRVEEKDAWNWNNETGIICPNFNTQKTIDPATSLKDPARWILTAGVAGANKDITCDDFAATGGAKAYTMDFGAVNYFEGEATGVAEVKTKAAEQTDVYTADGIYVGNSTKGLAKGLYIVNGKKFIVK